METPHLATIRHMAVATTGPFGSKSIQHTTDYVRIHFSGSVIRAGEEAVAELTKLITPSNTELLKLAKKHPAP